MPTYRVHKSGVWKDYQEGDVVTTPIIMENFANEGWVEEISLPIGVDVKKEDVESGGGHMQLVVKDIIQDVDGLQ